MSTGEDLRDQGMGLALRAEVNKAWKEEYCEEYCRAVMCGEEFTAATLLEATGMPPGSPNVIGAWFNALVTPDLKSGLVVRLGSVKSTRPSRHANHLGLYRLRKDMQ